MRFLQTFQLYDFMDTLVSLLTAFVLGTLIGAERQYRQRSAGLRTNVLVAVGASAFVDLANRLAGAEGSVRVIAYVVSGIGFLGAGAIMKEGINVRGLNTAATLWASAAVGCCAGADMVAQAALLTLFVLGGNTLLRPLQRDRSYPHRRAILGGQLRCAGDDGHSFRRIGSGIASRKARGRELSGAGYRCDLSLRR
jgi:putative Mg2+ transporter-C (MgtC) family protein